MTNIPSAETGIVSQSREKNLGFMYGSAAEEAQIFQRQLLRTGPAAKWDTTALCELFRTFDELYFERMKMTDRMPTQKTRDTWHAMPNFPDGVHPDDLR